ncbi:flippase-like domain-containing protein [bacterium]|nr:flippase-like domain-containing protein [bacterium]
MKKIIDKKKLVQFLKFILGLALFLFIVIELGTRESWTSIVHFKMRDLFIIWILTLGLNLIASYRWHLLIRHIGVFDFTYGFILKVSLLARFSGQTISQIIGDVGVKSLYIGDKIPLKKAMKSILWDKGLEILLLISVLLLMPIIVFCPIPEMYLILCVPLLIFMVFIAIHFSIYIAGISKANTIKWIPDITITLSNKQKLFLSLLTFSKYLCVVIRYMIFLCIFQINLNFIQVFFGTSIAQIGNLIGITPGGLGFVEAGWTGVLKYYNIDAGKIAAFLLSQRIIILFVVFINFLMVTLWDKIKKK